MFRFAARRTRVVRRSAPRLIALSFLVAALAGTLLLALPFSHEAGARLTFLQAAFTAVSAVSATGLAVVDTASTFSTFGEVVIMLLMQIGGLGIVTFGTLFALFLGRRLGFGERAQLAQQSGAPDVNGIVPLVRLIVFSTVAVELVGALLLFTRFAPQEGWARGAYHALFHSISAFNGGGFALYPDGLARFAGDVVVSGTVAALILLGSLGFLVLVNVALWRRAPRRSPLTLQTKIVLAGMGALTVFGVLAFLALEYTNPRTLGPLPFGQKLVASVFQGVTPRSAGLNTLDYTQMRPATLLLTLLLMFVGGAPGSAAGGLKVTTVFVLGASVLSFVRGRGAPVAFARRLDPELTLRALVVLVLSFLAVNAGLLLLVLTNPGLPFLNLLFEAVSAVGTVGLSMNTTPLLNPAGQLVLIFLMFLGRVGPLTFALAAARRVEPSPVSYPTEKNVLIG